MVLLIFQIFVISVGIHSVKNVLLIIGTKVKIANVLKAIKLKKRQKIVNQSFY
jgi:hypothetical protein